jgi:hypothetical protein
MNDHTIPNSIKCIACGEAATTPSPMAPPLCRECAAVAETLDIMNSHGMDMNEAHFDLVEEAITDLRQEKAAFRTIRRYAALLNTDVATALFQDPNHSFCLEPE